MGGREGSQKIRKDEPHSYMGFVDTEYTWRGRVMYMQTVIIQVGQR